MGLAIILATAAILFALWPYHVATKGAELTARAIGYFAFVVALASIWQYEIFEQEPNLTLVTIIGVGALIVGLGLLPKALR